MYLYEDLLVDRCGDNNDEYANHISHKNNNE